MSYDIRRDWEPYPEQVENDNDSSTLSIKGETF